MQERDAEIEENQCATAAHFDQKQKRRGNRKTPPDGRFPAEKWGQT